MEPVPDQATWQPFVHPAFRIQFRYPAVTPQGHMVARNQERHQHPDAERVHLMTPESREVYIEVVRFADLAPHDEYVGHRATLEQRFGAGAVTTLTEASLGPWPAWAYGFRWEQGERSVLLLPVGRDTYRLISDPRSPLNAAILATVVIVA